MLRAALTYQLILAVAVGPMLCCCSAGKTLARPSASPPASTSVVQHASVESAPHACCAHRRVAREPAHDKAPAPTKPDAPCGKCPCKDAAGKAELTHIEVAQTDLSQFLRALGFDASLSFVLLALTVPVSEPSTNPSPRRAEHAPSPADQILYAHHNLRC
ncbi:hypothetical protein GobsT_26600 [Gemmata obscuriglobus]|nr:hypothetical protein GobsT_26600 [Gemmata obscuriglobus]VTS05318.1 unnamed protein product [Gemmata obscuriglobus UQM 2246]